MGFHAAAANCASAKYSIPHLGEAIPPPYRHPERSRGIFVVILFLTNSADPFA